MSMDQSGLWKRDMMRVLETLPELKDLAGASVMITGAAGLICSALTDLLAAYNETASEPIRIYAAGRSWEGMETRFDGISRRPWFSFVPYDATDLNHLEIPRTDFIIHGAGNAFPKAIMDQPVETMVGNILGLYRLLQAADRNGCRRVLYISSSDVYGRMESPGPYRENESGRVELLDTRSSYSMGKRAGETLCAAFSAEYGVETVIARPGHIYGPTCSERDNRVASAFARKAARGEDIVMKSDGSQVRSYCYCLDCVSALLKILMRGKNLEAYNISNPDSLISIRRMAEILAEAGGVRLITEQANEAERREFNPMPNSTLNSERLQALGWKGLFDAETGLKHTVRILRES